MEPLDIQIKDAGSELSGLKLECKNEAENLTNILKSIDSAKEELIVMGREKLDFGIYCDKIRKELKEDGDRITAEKMNLVTMKETSSKELNQLKNDIKIANKELSLANDRIFKARKELEDIELRGIQTAKKVSELNILVEMLPNIQTEIGNLENKRNKIKIEISEMIDSSTLELTNAKETIRKMQVEVDKKIQEANQAEYKCKKYIDELYTHMNDYQIVRSRLETIWGQTFPELDLKI